MLQLSTALSVLLIIVVIIIIIITIIIKSCVDISKSGSYSVGNLLSNICC